MSTTAQAAPATMRPTREVHVLDNGRTITCVTRTAPFTQVEDVVMQPLSHDTADEISQPSVADWRAGECEAIPGRTMPRFKLLKRDYTKLYEKMTSLGEGIRNNGVGAHGLRGRLTPEQLASFETGVLYHLLHEAELLGVVAGHPDLRRRKGLGHVGEHLVKRDLAVGQDFENAQGRVQGIVEAEVAVREEDVPAHLACEERLFLLHLRLDQGMPGLP